jgi:hypothetical protein
MRRGGLICDTAWPSVAGGHGRIPWARMLVCWEVDGGDQPSRRAQRTVREGSLGARSSLVGGPQHVVPAPA